MKALLLVGDSIIDNHHWHSPRVGNMCTGDTLSRILPKDVNLYNHAVEETTASDWIVNTLNGPEVDPSAAKRPYEHYIDSAKWSEVKTSYPFNGKGMVEFFPDIEEKNVTVVISAIGNDLFLLGEWGKFLFKPHLLVERLRLIFDAYRSYYPGCKIVYVFPYIPTHIHGINITWGLTKRIMDWYCMWFKEKISMHVDELIDLSTEFKAGKHYADPGTGIPEPTVGGAQKLAGLIKNVVPKE